MNSKKKQLVTVDELAEAVRALTADVRALRSSSTGDAIKSVRAIARHLGIGYVTAHNLLKLGKIPARKVGESWVASRSALDRWLVGLPAHPDMDLPTPTPAKEQGVPVKRRVGRPSKSEEMAARRAARQEEKGGES